MLYSGVSPPDASSRVLRAATSSFALTADATGGASEAGAAAELLQTVIAAIKAERESSLCAAVAVVGALGGAAFVIVACADH